MPVETPTPEEYVQRAYAYNSKGQYDLAIADCGKAIELGALLSAPNLAHAYIQRAYAYNSKGQYDLAIADCGKAIELGPNLAHAYALELTPTTARGSTTWLSPTTVRRASLTPTWRNRHQPRRQSIGSTYLLFLWEGAQ